MGRHFQEPCPGRIVDQTGAGFGMGCIGGFFHTLVTKRNDFPKGERFSGAFNAAKKKGPATGVQEMDFVQYFVCGCF